MVPSGGDILRASKLGKTDLFCKDGSSSGEPLMSDRMQSPQKAGIPKGCRKKTAGLTISRVFSEVPKVTILKRGREMA
jgi:hypothetical protein